MDVFTNAANMKNCLGCRRDELSIDLFVCCSEMKNNEKKQGSTKSKAFMTMKNFWWQIHDRDSSVSSSHL